MAIGDDETKTRIGLSESIENATSSQAEDVLLKQAVHYEPDYTEAWFLLGSCQERNPKWRRDAAESFQQVLSVDPNHIEALTSLGDLYRLEGMGSRAQSCYEDVLKISPENQQAKNRLTALKKR